MRSSVAAIAAVLALSAPALTPAVALAAPAAKSDAAPSIDMMKRLVKELSSDAYEGRAPGTVGEEKTLALLTAEFEKLGLKPGNKGSWFQDVPLVEITAKNVSALSFTGGKAPITAAYGPEMVIGTYRTTQPRIEVKDSPVVFVGYGINAPEKGWNDYAGLDVKGKTVLILVNDPDYQTPGLTGPFNGRAMTYYGRWTYKFEEAARQGAAAAIIIHDTEPAAYGWNVVQSSWTGSQHVADNPGGNADQSAAIGWIQKDKAAALFADAGLNLDQQMAAAKQKGFKAVPLGAIKANVSFDNDLRKHASKNVVALLPGKTRPDEYVLYSAHWDHLGHCQAAPDGDDICNGAVDNATGTAALVALAQANVKAGPSDRSQVFLAVTGEESGLLGSAYYGDNPVFPFSKTVGGVNMDALSVAGLAKNVVVIGKGKSQLDAYLDRALGAQGRVATLEPTPEKGYYYRSDHFSFAKHGLPMLYFEGGEDLVKGGTAAGMAAAEDYTEHRYHGPKDEYDPNWDWTGVAADLKLYYDVGRALANTTDWPNWVDGDEFRAIRDKDRAGK
ncbi:MULTISPECIES: M28 family metallopeptidase [Sphingobium]|jgi:Zn-dependent M28 family amino/carboxypeptidase|uniref:Peptidase M28 n=2 Tax=Sphingobium yanoikuyae TaxID=13690 RepID=A0A0J9FJZ7_SPHYA|nr:MULTISPECIES: M28 family metallopeptidase [Sphingobium]ATP18998.1 peptidase M28 [Sphingobium yanoikuyae]KMW28815.1 peptidase M28 [Sphingobium yanoikuyae]TKV41588.1 peptidase M28 [Sphingobium sp. MP9-4]